MTETNQAALPAPAGAQVYTFGEPEAVLDRRELFGMFETAHNSRWIWPHKGGGW